MTEDWNRLDPGARANLTTGQLEGYERLKRELQESGTDTMEGLAILTDYIWEWVADE